MRGLWITGQLPGMLLLAAGLVAGAAAPSGSLHAASGERVDVRGRITDETGAAVPGHRVRLLKSRTILKLRGFATRDQNVEEMSATTSAHGFFEFNFPIDPKFRYYYLRFYDPQSFDVIKYQVPEDKDVSRRARKGRPVQADVVLKLQPSWPEVEALIQQYGAGSHRGQILRALGMPSRRLPQGADRELWEYDAAGVSYLIEGEKVLETRHADKGNTPGGPPDEPQKRGVVERTRKENR